MDAARTRPWVIVGGGLAAARAATTLRKEGFDGRLVVVTAENHPPYERPPLVKDYLRGESTADSLLAADASFWTSTGNELLLQTRAQAIDLGARRVRLDDRRWLDFEKLLIATGASAIRPDLPGANEEFVHVLRTIDDADRLRAAAKPTATAAVAGGGWMAAEAAASLRQLGLEVTLVVPGQEVLERHLGREIGAAYSALHERNGTRLIRGGRVAEVTGGSDRGLRLASGDHIRADLVVLGFGATPNVELARLSGLAISGGIEADRELRASAPDLFVAGDVAAPWHPRYGRHLRLEHWDTARNQGRIAALNMLGRATVYDRLPYFYSDQFDSSMETFGLPPAADRPILRRSSERSIAAVWLSDGRVEAAIQIDDGESSKALSRLARERVEIDPALFADPRVPLAELLPAVQPA